jgi:hypothetical protein
MILGGMGFTPSHIAIATRQTCVVEVLQNVTAANDIVDKSLHNSSIELIPLNTTGSNVFVGNQIIVVDFRQWYANRH